MGEALGVTRSLGPPNVWVDVLSRFELPVSPPAGLDPSRVGATIRADKKGVGRTPHWVPVARIGAAGTEDGRLTLPLATADVHNCDLWDWRTDPLPAEVAPLPKFLAESSGRSRSWRSSSALKVSRSPGALAHRATTDAERPYIVFGDRILTYGQVEIRADALAASMAHLGVKARGSRRSRASSVA